MVHLRVVASNLVRPCRNRFISQKCGGTSDILRILQSAMPIDAVLSSSSATIVSIARRSYNTIPIVVESGAMGERSFDIYSRLLRERIVCVHGEVTDQMASVVSAQLLFLEAEGPQKPLYMYINSPGGSVTAGLAIYDTMQYIQPSVYTIAMG